VFENIVPRKIFGHKRDEVTGEWRRLYNEELYDVYPYIKVIKSRRLIWTSHVARTGETIGAHRVLVDKPVGKNPRLRPKRRWENNIKINPQKVDGVWFGLIWFR
jgi:hypothetical protein